MTTDAVARNWLEASGEIHRSITAILEKRGLAHNGAVALYIAMTLIAAVVRASADKSWQEALELVRKGLENEFSTGSDA